ncbi:hypothetical protein GE09DRAFT_1161624 [Coniochaeta sp. 2T2.1]|nr:hypothetical protein GE09DRAFT_1161624 [Coniochaeta sp. 2T2.1]
MPTAPLLGPSTPSTAERILVQTRTSLVPGDDYAERCRLMRNLICQHQWKRDYNHGWDRWYEYRALFGYENRRCYFVVDGGQAADETEDVPVIRYKWDGEMFTPIYGPLPPRMELKLKDFPFTPVKLDRKRNQDQAQPQAITNADRREVIRARLRSNMKLPDSDRDFLREHPEELQVLRQDMAPQFINKIGLLCGEAGGG